MDHLSKFSISEITDDMKAFFTGKTPLFDRGIIMGHTDFDKVMDKIVADKDFIIVSGFSASGDFHYGHKAVIKTLTNSSGSLPGQDSLSYATSMPM